jgi:hypothetical protein
MGPSIDRQKLSSHYRARQAKATSPVAAVCLEKTLYTIGNCSYPRSFHWEEAAVAKKSASKRASKSKPGGIVYAGHSILINLSAADQRRAAQCLAKNGKITFSVKEHSVTKLPQLLDNGKQID